jgi:hypothetical protein
VGAVSLWQIFNVSLARFIAVLVVSLLIVGYVYAVRIKPNFFGRSLYIGAGVCLLGTLLFLLTMLFRNSETYFAQFPLGSTGDNIVALLSFVVCYIIGGVIGDFIGKRSQYRWPPVFIGL